MQRICCARESSRTRRSNDSSCRRRNHRDGSGVGAAGTTIVGARNGRVRDASRSDSVDPPRERRLYGRSCQPSHLWGRSSVGRALESHSRGRGFDSPRLHFPAASCATVTLGSLPRFKSLLAVGPAGGFLMSSFFPKRSWSACASPSPEVPTRNAESSRTSVRWAFPFARIGDAAQPEASSVTTSTTRLRWISPCMRSDARP